MGFLLIFILITIVLPLIILGFRRNWKTILLCFVPPQVLVFVRNRMICTADHYSEACTWAYLGYAYALVLACAVYLVISGIQWALGRSKARQDDINQF